MKSTTYTSLKYVKTFGKARVDKELYGYSEVQSWLSKKGTVGLWIPVGMIVIDVDNKKEAEIIKKIILETKIKCGIHKTPKGYHFLFKDKGKRGQDVKKLTAIGIGVDTRVSEKGYIVMPWNDDERAIEREFNDECDYVPRWLLPLKNSSVSPDTVDWSNGARNDQLQSHVWRLRQNGFDEEETKDIIYLINEFVLESPLTPRELETTVLRAENLKLAQERSKFKFNLFADDILARVHIRTINDLIYSYDSGVYRPMDIESFILDQKSDLKRSQRQEVIDYIKIRTRSKRDILHKINCRNGYVDRFGNLEKHTNELVSTTQTNFFYNKEVYVPEIDIYLDDISSHNVEKKNLILEMIGASMFDDNIDQKMFILLGEKASNGKSSFLQLVSRLVGNVSNVTLANIASGGFFLPELDGALINVSADIKTSFMEDTEMLKLLTGNDSITVARKYGQPFTLTSFATFIFSANRIPNTKVDNGFIRRLCIIDFTNQFPANSRFMIENLYHQDALNYLGTLAIDAYVARCRRGKWSYEEDQKELLKKYLIETDNVYEFLSNYDFKEGTKSTDFYQDYTDYCFNNHNKAKSNRNFYATVNTKFYKMRKTVNNTPGDYYYSSEEEYLKSKK